MRQCSCMAHRGSALTRWFIPLHRASRRHNQQLQPGVFNQNLVTGKFCLEPYPAHPIQHSDSSRSGREGSNPGGCCREVGAIDSLLTSRSAWKPSAYFSFNLFKVAFPGSRELISTIDPDKSACAPSACLTRTTPGCK